MTDSYLLEYYNEIKNGKIIAGYELRKELQNLIEDMESGEYIFDTAKAHKRIHFMENCVRLTKSPFYNKPMKLMLFQKAFIESVYSFKMLDGSERFKKILLLIARKNGKSELTAAMALGEFLLGDAGEDIVCSSNDDNQASIVYDAVDTMRQMIDPFDLDTKRNQRFMLNKETGTKIFKLSDRTRNKEGRNIDFAICDETHEMKTNTIGMSIEQSQSLKANPKFINITTEGFVEGGYLDDELRKFRAVLNGEDTTLAGKRMLPWLYTQDSEAEIWRNPNSWQKSNPSLGTIKKISYLQEKVEVAKMSKADRRFILSKDFNLKQNTQESWLNPEDYTYPAKFDLHDFQGAMCLGAVDLSETTDLTCAKILLMRQNDNTKYVYTKYFVPEQKIREKADVLAGAKYDEWFQNGYITVSEGADNDLTLVADWFYSLYTDYDIRLWKCGYDQRFARDWINQMAKYGWTKESGNLEMIIQNAYTLSNATKLVENDLKTKRMNYNENPIDMWCFGNSAIKVDNYNNCLCVKQKPTMKIDGAVTTIILYEMYRRWRSDFKNLI